MSPIIIFISNGLPQTQIEHKVYFRMVSMFETYWSLRLILPCNEVSVAGSGLGFDSLRLCFPGFVLSIQCTSGSSMSRARRAPFSGGGDDTAYFPSAEIVADELAF